MAMRWRAPAISVPISRPDRKSGNASALRCAHQPRGARREQRVQQLGMVLQPEAHAVVERRRGERAAELHQPPEDAVLREQCVQLAGHPGLEAVDAIVGAEPGPFAVRAGQHAAGARRQIGAPQLGLFAAHHIDLSVAADTAQTRHDVQAVAVAELDRGQLPCRLRRAGRALEVRRLDPALAAADHAAGDAGAAAMRRQPVAAQPEQGLGEAPFGHGHHAGGGVARVEHAAVGAKQAGAQVRSAPVEGDQRRGAHARVCAPRRADFTRGHCARPPQPRRRCGATSPVTRR